MCAHVCVCVPVCVFRHRELCGGFKAALSGKTGTSSVPIHHREEWKMPLNREIPFDSKNKKNKKRETRILGKPFFKERQLSSHIWKQLQVCPSWQLLINIQRRTRKYFCASHSKGNRVSFREGGGRERSQPHGRSTENCKKNMAPWHDPASLSY